MAMRALVRDATAEYFIRQIEERRRKEKSFLWKINYKKIALAVSTAAVLCVSTSAFLKIRNEKAAYLYSGRNEELVGRRIAEIATSKAGFPKTATIMPLFGSGNEAHSPRVKALAGALGKNCAVNLYWPADERGYDADENYGKWMSSAISRHSDSNAIIVISAGGISHLSMTGELKSFIEKGGLLVFSGEAEKDSVPVKLALEKKALLIAHRTGWLKAEGAKEKSAAPIDFFDANYKVMGM